MEHFGDIEIIYEQIREANSFYKGNPAIGYAQT